jgi:hypothetical protein
MLQEIGLESLSSALGALGAREVIQAPPLADIEFILRAEAPGETPRLFVLPKTLRDSPKLERLSTALALETRKGWTLL